MTTLAATQQSVRRHWKLTAAVVVGLLTVSLLYVSWVYSAATEVEGLLDEAEALDIAAIARGDEDALESAESLLNESESATSSLSARLGPARVAAASLGWVPWAGDQVKAPVIMIDRAEADLTVARRLVSSADDLFALQDLVVGGGLVSTEGSQELDTLLNSLSEHAEAVSAKMAVAEAHAARMDGASLIWFLKSRERKISSLETKLQVNGEVLVATPPAIEAAREIKTSATQLLNLLDESSNVQGLGDLVVSLDDFTEDSTTAAVAMAEFDRALGEAMPGTVLSAVSSRLSLSLHAVADLSDGLNVIGANINEALTILNESDDPLLSNGDELQRALAVLADDREAITRAAVRADAALTVLEEQVIAGGIDFLDDDLAATLIDRTGSLVDAGRVVSDGPTILRELIAPGSSKTYLVLGQTADELRAAGGFTSSAWTLTFEDGSLTDTNFIPIVDFDRAGSTAGPEVPQPLAYYMDAGALYLRDVGWDPDFASVGRTAVELYRLNQPGEVDGVIAVNQWAIVRLIQALGGVEVDGEFVSPDEILAFIEQRTDSDGTGFLQVIFSSILQSLRGDLAAKTQLDLLEAFSNALEQKDLMLYMVDADEQQMVREAGWSGNFPFDDRDRLGIVDSNFGWSKSDRSIARSAVYEVDLSSVTSPAARLTLSYDHGGAQNGRDCSTHSPPSTRFATYEVSINSCYWNYFRAFVAAGSSAVNAPDLPLPANSVPDLLDLQAAGSSTFSQEFDENGDYFAGLIAIEPGASEEFSIGYVLPESVVTETERGLRYELVLISQPGAQGRRMTVELQLPAGHTLGDASQTPSQTRGSILTFEINLQSDRVLWIETVSPA